jgi:hypothetical protein
MSSTAVTAEAPPLPPWQRAPEAPIGAEDVAWARRFLRRWRVARTVIVLLLGAATAYAVSWALTSSPAACRRRADDRLAALAASLRAGGPPSEGWLLHDGAGERLLVLTDGAVLLQGDTIVAGGPRCPTSWW